MAFDKNLKKAASGVIVSVALSLHDIAVLWSAGIVLLPSLDSNNQRDLFDSLAKLQDVTDSYAGKISI